VRKRFVHFRPHRRELFQRRGHVVHVPVGNHAARPDGGPGWGIFAVDDAELVLLVAEAKLDVGGVFGVWAFEVRANAQ
jgi:hypothetical protein